MLSKRNRFSNPQRIGLTLLLGVIVVGAGAAAFSRIQDDGTPARASEGDTGTPAPATAVATQEPTATPTPSPTPTPTATPATASPELRDPAEALREGRYEAAAVAFLAASTAATDAATRSEALLGAASAQWEAGLKEPAVASLRQAVVVAPEGSAAKQRASLALALRLGAMGRNGETVEVLRPYVCACMGADPLHPYLEAEFARAAAATGDLAAANASWDALLASPSLPAGLAAEILSARAAAAKARGDRTGYLSWLEREVSLTGNPSRRYELATELRETDAAAANSHLLAIVSGSPAAGVAVRAVTELKEAGVPTDPGQEGLVHYRRGAYAAAIDVLDEPSRDPARNVNDRTFAAFYLAAAYEDSDRLDDAVREYDRAAAMGAESPYVHRARYWAARVTENKGDTGDAARRFLDLATAGPPGEFAAEAAFRAGYTLYRGGNVTGALASWAKLSSASQDARVLYWIGRAYESSGQMDLARAAYESAVAAGPLDFHGQQAAERLSGRATVDVRYRPRTLAGPDWGELERLAAAQSPEDPGQAPLEAAEFALIGLHARAAAVLTDAARGATAPRLVVLAKEADRLHLSATVLRLGFQLRTALGIESGTEPSALLRLLYPINYTATLDAEARAHGLDPLFLAALIRQESAWDARAGSSAGALGLTQVIPPTGEAIAQSLGTAFTPDDLFRPAISLKFGAYYISVQLGRYGDPYRALAAYNAGPGNADRWSRRGFANGADYVENIDIAETSHYVAVVMEHYAHYLAAYGP